MLCREQLAHTTHEVDACMRPIMHEANGAAARDAVVDEDTHGDVAERNKSEHI